MATERTLELFADYHQVNVQDDDINAGRIEGRIPKEALADRLMRAPDGRGVTLFTARNDTVPVAVRILPAAPEERDGFEAWDHVVDAGLDIPSGRIVVAGCSDYFPSAARFEVSPGHYALRVYFGKLGALSEDGLSGDDHYLVVLWPSSVHTFAVLKRWSEG